MRRALRLAARGRGRVEPNPMVGCVLVRGGRVLSEGWHRRFGGPHAEVDALRRLAKSGASARGATAYVTLEPCHYHGKTPPCVVALLAAGVKRVVAAMCDPNPRVLGGGFAVLRAAGVEVEEGVLREAAARLNAPFAKWITRGRPWVIAKWAQSLDGRIATRTRDSRWISDEAARAHAHAVRGRMDAIVVGVGTVLRDDPLLTCRDAPLRRVATRVVLDAQLRTPPRAKLVRTAREIPTMIFCAADAAAERAGLLERAGCEIVTVRVDRRGGVSLDAVLERLGAAQMTNVLIEGGGTVLGRVFDERIADEVHAYIAPRLIGGLEALSSLEGIGAARVADSLELAEARMRKLGSGWLLEGRFADPAATVDREQP